jgi:hypothetical protein
MNIGGKLALTLGGAVLFSACVDGLSTWLLGGVIVGMFLIRGVNSLLAFAVHLSKANQEMLHSAIAAHLAWNSRLHSAIESGKLDVPVAAVKVDNQCQFGKWLCGSQLSPVDKQTGNYRAVRRLHIRFHEEAAKIADLALSRDRQAPEQAMAPSGNYALVSSALIDALKQWSVAV